MFNEHFKVIKLKTGENIACTMSKDVRAVSGESYLTLGFPIQIVPHQEQRRGGEVVGESFILRPWMGLSDSDEFTVPADIILTIGDMKPEIQDQYVNYVTYNVEVQQRIRDEYEVMRFLNEITPGKLSIIDEGDLV